MSPVRARPLRDRSLLRAVSACILSAKLWRSRVQHVRSWPKHNRSRKHAQQRLCVCRGVRIKVSAFEKNLFQFTLACLHIQIRTNFLILFLLHQHFAHGSAVIPTHNIEHAYNYHSHRPQSHSNLPPPMWGDQISICTQYTFGERLQNLRTEHNH
jgi:hypothetical protein